MPYPPNLLKNVGEKHRINVIKTRTCLDKEYLIYDFKGKIIDGKMEGPGKLKISENEGILPTWNEVCVTREKYDSFYAKTIVGTFSNGSFNGNGKVTFEDGSVLISDFKNGGPAGFSRKFQRDGSLQEVFYQDIMKKGYKWMVNSEYLLYTDYTSFLNDHKNPVEDPNCIIFPLKNTQGGEILVGNINPALGILENVFEVDVKIKKNEVDNCFLELD